MAKELPYFRFTPQEWQNGDISVERYELRGLFIDICSYYWVKDCSVPLAMLEKRYINDRELIHELLELEIIDHNSDTGFISINFLDEQFDLLSEARKRRQDAGRKGGKKKASNAKTMLKQSSSYKDKDKDKEKDKEKDKSESEFSENDSKFLNFLCEHFSISEMKQPRQFMNVNQAIIFMKNQGEEINKHFRDQCWNYFPYKEESKEKKHSSIESFLFDMEQEEYKDRLMGGGWNKSNWLELRRKINKSEYYLEGEDPEQILNSF